MNSGTLLAEALVRTGTSDRGAFREVHRLTSAKLGHICVRICGSQIAGQDVLQDVYLTVWRRAAMFQPSKGSAIAWLSRIAQNRSIDWLRRESTFKLVPVELADEIADDRPTPGELVVLENAAAQVRRCLSSLRQEQQDAIRAAYYGGHTYSELADQTGVPIGTMKSWIRRGLATLRAQIELEDQ